jgi:PAS domain S-box-containing protein
MSEPQAFRASTSFRSPLIPGAETACAWLVGLTVALVLGIGLTNGLVWLESTRPWTLFPGTACVRFNTAVGLTSAALALAARQFSHRSRWWSWFALTLGVVPAVIGGLTATQDLAGVNLGIDTLFVPATFPGDVAHIYTVHPGRMSLNASLSLVFLGLALMTMDWVVRIGISSVEVGPALAMMAALPAFCAVVGHLLGVGGFTGILSSTNILFHAALCMLALAVGILASRPHGSVMSRVLSAGADGVMLRWMLPGCAVLMLTLSWAVQRGRAAGAVLPGEGTAIMLYGGMVLLFILSLIAAKAVARQQASARVAEAALREREQTFRALADNMSQLAWMTDETGALVWYNQRWFDYTGTTQEKMLSGGWHTVLHPDHLQRVEEKLRRCLADGTVWEDTFPIRGADGNFRWFLSRAMPIRDERARVLRWFGTNTDITEQRELARALEAARDDAEQASLAKDHFLAALSHELRTPLTPVLMSAAALRDDERLPSDVRADAAMIERNIGLESRLIDDLLDLTRITHGKLALRKERCDAHALARYALEIIRDEAIAKGVQVSMHMAAARSGLDVDPARMQQVFWNLLRNALKFTPAGGSITLVSRDAPSGHLVMEVSDTGIGFEADVAERLFMPFDQAGRETYHQFGGGLGLGLSIARAIVDAHGGTLQGSSPGAGQGAKFVVALPGAGEPPTTPGRAARPEGTSTLSTNTSTGECTGVRVLLVEDHEPTLMMLQRLLTRRGHAVTMASSVAAGVSAMEQGPFELVISDLGLPDGTGLQLMQQLLEKDAGLRGIALSGYGMEEDLLRSRQAGFQQHLVKPVNMDRLMEAVEAILAKNPVAGPD